MLGWKSVGQASYSEVGFLNLLEHGDTVLADRGFTISDDLAVHGARLAIPPLPKESLSSVRKKWNIHNA